MEDAVSQLQDLGVTRGQAKKALARYNNDVARAADFIFSGNYISDDETEENTVESDEALALRLSAEEQRIQESFHSAHSNPFDNNTMSDKQIQQSDLPASQAVSAPTIQQNAEIVPPTIHDTSTWSVVPYKSQENINMSVPPPPDTFTSRKTSIESSLTWWKDPEDPSERVAFDDLPIGLRPPSYNFAYSPVILQALFHITAFQQAVLSFRPVPYAWGAPKNYWKGFGEPVPGYIMKQVVTKRQVLRNTNEPPPPPPPSAEISEREESQSQKEIQLISLNSSPKQSSSPSTSLQEEQEQVEVEEKEVVVTEDKEEKDDTSTTTTTTSEINENITQQDTPPLIVESATTPEQIVEYVDLVDNELRSMPKCLQTLSELQKIFAFLGNSRRLYGSVSHYVRALNSKMASNGWEFSDRTFDAFLDTVINALVEADEQSEDAIDPAFVPVFRNMFLVKARIEYGDDYDDEEVYYLTLSTDKNMCSFHDCLDPLVFESYQLTVDENEADPTLSDGGDEQEKQTTYKFTSFKQTPPILMVLLDNNRPPTTSGKTADNRYMIDKTIYMDRYMSQKKDQALEGFQQMDASRREIVKARAEMEKIKCDGQLSMDKRDLLYHTLNYFEQKKQEEAADEEILESLKNVLNSAKEKIESRLEELENVIIEQQDKMHNIFDKEDMKENSYELRASFHHDGKSGTGHYWAYIWIELSEESLLQDLPTKGGWYKFCDALVTAATETEIHEDPYPPFALMYVSASTPQFTKSQLYDCLPAELKEFMTADNNLLEQEINAYNMIPSGISNNSLISTEGDDMDEVDSDEEDEGVGKLRSTFADMDLSSTAFDDDISVGTAVGAGGLNHTEYLQQEQQEQQQYSFTGQAFNKLKDRVNAKIVEVSNYPNDDYRLLKSFEIFLARTQNQLLLEHLYLLYSSEKMIDGVETMIVDEEASKQDEDLKIIWHEYESYLVIGEMMTQALTYFVKKEFSSALQSLLDLKRHEASWKTQVMFDMDVSNAFSGLATISFNHLVETYGKACLKHLNDTAYFKASHESYRTRGLEDALRIAHQAQTVIGPDKLQNDEVYISLGEKWLTFTEQEGVTLTSSQEDLLNTLVMTYLEGQSGSISNVHSRSGSPARRMDVDDEDDEVSDIPLWQKYQQVCLESEKLLTQINNK